MGVKKHEDEGDEAEDKHAVLRQDKKTNKRGIAKISPVYREGQSKNKPSAFQDAFLGVDGCQCAKVSRAEKNIVRGMIEARRVDDATARISSTIARVNACECEHEKNNEMIDEDICKKWRI